MPLAAPVKLLTNMMYSCWPFWGPTFAWGRAGDAKSHDAQPPVSVEVRFQKPWDPSGAFLLPACRVHYETVSFSRDLPRVLFAATAPQPLCRRYFLHFFEPPQCCFVAACGGCKMTRSACAAGIVALWRFKKGGRGWRRMLPSSGSDHALPAAPVASQKSIAPAEGS